MLSAPALPLASPWFGPLAVLAAIWLAVAELRSGAVRRDAARATCRPSVLAALAAASVPVLLYWQVIHSWWLHDDPSILRQVLEYPVLANLYDPAVWRAYSPANFTPMLLVSFWLDLSAFGIEPAFFYLHQLAALAAAAGLGYWLLARFLRPVLAFLVVVLIMLSPSVTELAQSLMTRHYIEGLVALLLALIAFGRGQSTGRLHWAWAASILYLIAALSKEVYAPAIVMFPLLMARFRPLRHWLPLVPLGLAAVLYAIWRLHMLGSANLVAGYGDLLGVTAEGAADAALVLSARLGLDHWLRLLPVSLLCLLALFLLAKRRELRTLGLALVSLLAACVPLIPLLPDVASRSLLLPTIWVYVVAALGLQRFAAVLRPPDGQAAVALLPVAMFAGLTWSTAVAASAWQRPADADRARAEWDFMMTAEPRATLVEPMNKPWYYVNAAWLRQRTGDGAKGPALCYTPCLCTRAPGHAYFRFAGRKVQRYDPDLSACPTLLDKPLGVSLHYDAAHGVLQWDLSPQRDGRWFYARVPVFDLAAIPRQGKTPYQLKWPVRLQFFFVSVQGWTTASPVLTLDPTDIDADQTLRAVWSRGMLRSR